MTMVALTQQSENDKITVMKVSVILRSWDFWGGVTLKG